MATGEGNEMIMVQVNKNGTMYLARISQSLFDMISSPDCGGVLRLKNGKTVDFRRRNIPCRCIISSYIRDTAEGLGHPRFAEWILSQHAHYKDAKPGEILPAKNMVSSVLVSHHCETASNGS